MFAPPKVTIRRYAASRFCDVVVVVRGQEMVIRCPSYAHSVKWARLERKSYKIPEPITDLPDSEEHDRRAALFAPGWKLRAGLTHSLVLSLGHSRFEIRTVCLE